MKGLATAALLALIFGLLHLAGLRDWVSILSGTPVEGVPFELAALGGAAYVVAWFGAVLVAPVLTLSSALALLTEPWGAGRATASVAGVRRRRRAAEAAELRR